MARVRTGRTKAQKRNPSLVRESNSLTIRLVISRVLGTLTSSNLYRGRNFCRKIIR